MDSLKAAMLAAALGVSGTAIAAAQPEGRTPAPAAAAAPTR